MIIQRENILSVTRYNHLLVKYRGKQMKIFHSLFPVPCPIPRGERVKFPVPHPDTGRDFPAGVWFADTTM